MSRYLAAALAIVACAVACGPPLPKPPTPLSPEAERQAAEVRGAALRERKFRGMKMSARHDAEEKRACYTELSAGPAGVTRLGSCPVDASAELHRAHDANVAEVVATLAPGDEAAVTTFPTGAELAEGRATRPTRDVIIKRPRGVEAEWARP